MAAGRKNNGARRSNAGRKSLAKEAGLQKLFEECWTVAERRACIRALVAKTKGEDFSLAAVKLLLAYAYGKPVDHQKLTGADGGQVEMSLSRKQAVDKIYGARE